eukprot:SAG31_NODE_396_length_16264_cov_17.206496_7_plen_70_part_00
MLTALVWRPQGCHWLLHIDVDEALCCTGIGDTVRALAASQGAATRWFAKLPDALDQVTFLNHEAVSPGG